MLSHSQATVVRPSNDPNDMDTHAAAATFPPLYRSHNDDATPDKTRDKIITRAAWRQVRVPPSWKQQQGRRRKSTFRTPGIGRYKAQEQGLRGSKSRGGTAWVQYSVPCDTTTAVRGSHPCCFIVWHRESPARGVAPIKSGQ